MATKTKENIPVSITKNNNKNVAKSTWPSVHPIANMEKMFDKIFGQHFPALWNYSPMSDTLFEFDGLRMPSLDVIDREDEIVVRAEIPGVEKENIDISLADNVLTIKGHTSAESNQEKGDYYRHEISSSSFARSITLPTSVKESNVVADLKHGVLNVKLPKSETSKRKSIKIL